MKEDDKKRATMDEQFHRNENIRRKLREIICKNMAHAINALDNASFADEYLEPTADRLEINLTVHFGRGGQPVMDNVKMDRKEKS